MANANFSKKLKKGSEERIRQNVSVIDFPIPGVSPTLPLLIGGTTQDKIDTDFLLDPAEQVLLCVREAKKRRQQAELQFALDKIQQRVDHTLNEYEDPNPKSPSQTIANREAIDDPVYLYELLGDSIQRTKYQQKLTIFILGYEDKCDSRERLLSSLQDFFIETQAGGTQTLLDDLEDGACNLDDATLGLKSAMDTAQKAAQRLLTIKQGISKLIAIIGAYPDTKKGRKKLDKALLKAQEEVESLSNNLEQVQSELEEATNQVKLLQQEVERKCQECAVLKIEADKVKLLEVGKDECNNVLKAAQLEIERLKLELKQKESLHPSKLETTTLAIDKNQMQDLYEQFVQQKEHYEALLADRDSQHKEEVNKLMEDHEAEMDEVKQTYEDQLKSLMEDELYPFEDEELSVCELLSKDSNEDVLVEATNSEKAISYAASEKEADKSAEMIDYEDADKSRPTLEPDNIPPVLTEECEVNDTNNSRNVSALQTVAKTSAETKLRNKSRGQTIAPSHHHSVTPARATLEDLSTSSLLKYSYTGMSEAHLASTSSVLNELRAEFEFKEKKLKHEIDNLKAKSRKSITALRAQITLSQNKENRELKTAENQVRKLRSIVEELETERTSLKKQNIALLKSKKDNLLSEQLLRGGELESQVKQFKRETEYSSSDSQQPLLKSLVDRGVQWSEGEITDKSIGATSTPLIQMPMENALPSLLHEPKESIQMNSSYTSSVSEASSSPLCESMVMSNGLPLQLSSKDTASGQTLSTLAQLQLPLQLADHELAHSHGHMVVEWRRVCEDVKILRDSLIEVLFSNDRFPSAMNDLFAVTIHTIDWSKDVCNEITTCRVSISRFLHQLIHSLSSVLTDPATHAREKFLSAQGKEGDENKKRVTVQRLIGELKEQKNSMQKELKESKVRITSLSSQVTTLKAEMTSIKQSLALSDADKDRVVMFTRLDSERNYQNLVSALEKNKLSLSDLNKVTAETNEYLAIAGQGLANLSQNISVSTHSKQLVKDIQHHYGASPKASEVLDRLSQLKYKKKLKFSVQIDQLRLKRLDLACTLTYTLQRIEKHSGVFLVKPVFYKITGLGAHSLVYPISRLPPVKKAKALSHSQITTPHPSMRLVSKLIQQNKKSDGFGDAFFSKKQQQMSHTLHTSHIPHTIPGNEMEWSVETSRTVTHVRDFLNPTPPMIPTHPRIVDIDIKKQRHHHFLLRGILPCPHQVQADQAIHRIPQPTKPVSPTSSYQEKVTKSKSKELNSTSAGMVPIRVKCEFPSIQAPLPPIVSS